MRGVRAPHRRTAHTAHPPVRGCGVGCAVGGANLAATAHRSPAPPGEGWSANRGEPPPRRRTAPLPPSCLGLSRYPTRTPSDASGHVQTHTRRPPGRSGPFTADRRRRWSDHGVSRYPHDPDRPLQGLVAAGRRQPGQPDLRHPRPSPRLQARPARPAGPRELDVHHITADDREDDKKLLAEQVAGYVAKYATKATGALGVTLDHRIGEAELEDLDLPARVAELVRACWKLGARPVLESCGCGSGRTCLASVATSRPRAAATPPPWGRCGRPGSPTPSAAPAATPSRWTRGAAGGRAGRGRRCLVVPRRLGLSDEGGGVAGCLAGCSGSGSAADRQGGATYQNDRCMTRGRETTVKGGRLWRSCC